MMDFVWAMIYPFRGRRWYLYFPLLTVGLLIPIFGFILGFAYATAIIRHVYDGDYDLPNILSIRLQEGLHVLWNACLHIVVWLAIAGLLVTILGFTVYQREHDTIVYAVFLVIFVPFCLSVMRYALTNDPITMIQISRTLNLIYKGRWTIARFMLNSMLFCVAGFAAYLVPVSAIADLGPRITHTYYYHAEANPFLLFSMLFFTPIFYASLFCGISYLIGQLARRLAPSDDGEKHKNDKIKSSMI